MKTQRLRYNHPSAWKATGDISFFINYVMLHSRTEFYDDDEPKKKRHPLQLWLRAWNPCLLASEIGSYGSRKGIDKQEGGSTYYTGNAQYVESPPPQKDYPDNYL